MSRTENLEFASFGIKLEGILHLPDGDGLFPALTVCHPHPLYGGNMDNNIVVAIAEQLPEKGIAVLRFNFRGIGDSQGDYSEGLGEVEDADEARKFLASHKLIDSDRVGLAGYSFGARMVLEVASKEDPPKAIGLVAAPTNALLIFNSVTLDMPKLLINGDKDTVAKFDRFAGLAYGYSDPKEVHVVSGADHLFDGHESQVANLVANFFEKYL